MACTLIAVTVGRIITVIIVLRVNKSNNRSNKSNRRCKKNIAIIIVINVRNQLPEDVGGWPTCGCEFDAHVGEVLGVIRFCVESSSYV